MTGLIEVLEHVLHVTVEISSICMEFVGIGIMIFYALKSFIEWAGNKEEFHLDLGDGISTALEFLMVGEVLKTATASGMSDYIALAAIIALRFALTLEVHWEQKHHKEELAEHHTSEEE